MQSGEIRERFLAFFERNGHLRVPSASLVPSVYDPTVLLTTAGMQPFKPYFRGEEEPPSRRLTSCQKSFRTTDIENVGLTLRHLTFFEMLGNFSVGDYFKEEAVRFALDLSTNPEHGFGLRFEDIWVTVFGGDEALGLGPDQEAIDHWRAVGVPDERIVLLGREDNFWQSGPTGPVRSLLGAVPRPRPRLRPRQPIAQATTPSASSSSGTSCSCSTSSRRTGRSPSCPRRTSTPAWGSSGWRAIMQEVPSLYETDLFAPLDRARRGAVRQESTATTSSTTRALRVISDHGRGGHRSCSPTASSPSNEDRGYILRRIMRRAIQQGHVLGIDEPSS